MKNKIHHILNNYFNKGHQRSQVLKKNAVLGFLIKGISIPVNLLYVPLLIGYLDTERYGVWLTITSFLAWFHFLDIGVGNGLRNKLTEAISKGSFDYARKLISTSYALMVIIFGTVSLSFLLVNNYLPWNYILNVEFINLEELRLLTAIIFFFLCLRFIVQLIQPILFAMQKSALASVFPVIGNLLGLILIYIVTKTTLPPLLTASLILSILPVFTFLIGSIYIFSKKYSSLKPNFNSIDFSLSKDILNLGFKFFFIQIASVIINSSSSFIIIHIFGPNEVTQYNVAYKYFQVVLMLNAILLAPLWSATTQAIAVGDYDWAKKILKKMNILSLVQISIVISMLIVSPWILDYWTRGMVEIPFGLSLAMCFYMILILILSPYSQLLNGSGKLRVSLNVILISTITFITLALILGQTRLGVAGIVLASCIIKFISMFIEVYQVKLILNQKDYGIWAK